MTPFVTFALVLTFIYVLYYAVVITMDLHNCNHLQKKNEEVIDVTAMGKDIEEPVVVTENRDNGNDGFMTFTEQTEDGLRVITPTSTSAPVPTTQQPEDVSGQEPSPHPQKTSEQLNEEHEMKMEAVHPTEQEVLVSEEFLQSLQNKANKRYIIKENVYDNL